MKKIIGIAVLIILCVGFGYSGYDYFHYRAVNAVSDAGFVRSDSLTVLSFKVDGKIEKVYKNEGDKVKKGELLAKIDETDLKVKLEELQLSRSEMASEIDAISHAKASNGAKLKKISADKARYEKLYEQKLISKNELEQLSSEKVVVAELIASQGSQIEGAKQKLEGVKKAIEAVQNKISYTSLKAPFEGVVAKRYTNTSSVVDVGTPIYAIVDPNDLHLEVLLSEKELGGIKEGNSATFSVDSFKDKQLKGVVTSIMPTSASTFSLVPRDIASGEFTKLDQRFVIKISIDDKKELRAGMGASVAILRK